jgi:hypothetical protein
VVTFKDGKWFCSGCGARLDDVRGVPQVARVMAPDRTVTEVVSDDGVVVHRCSVEHDDIANEGE